MTEQAPNITNLSSLYLRLPNPNCELLRIMRFELMREVQQRKTKISDFFKAGPSPAEKRSRTESETSSVSVTSTSSNNLPNVSSGSSSSLLQDIPYTP
ncbi:Hypothetical protein FKW44_016338 [Caligus rogercresseyi]|uniref:Uncharacterized protein n=1 Tax=Caligus rogercresseyi TaxID=217165 RepID=A0A7T8H2B5_CALRO|nr:Hypothetical protein FKW44_016338 [Caligus rogercresseyi]